jgi:hypothetical protein
MLQDITCVSPDLIDPVHEPNRPQLTPEISGSMRKFGWLGRPLLVVRDGNRLQALTGSHRLASARAVGLRTIPVLEVPEPQASLIRGSCYYPKVSHEIVKCLFEHNESWLGRFILMDGWVNRIERPWGKAYLEQLREFGHEDMIEIMSVRKWRCRG